LATSIGVSSNARDASYFSGVLSVRDKVEVIHDVTDDNKIGLLAKTETGIPLDAIKLDAAH